MKDMKTMKAANRPAPKTPAPSKSPKQTREQATGEYRINLPADITYAYPKLRDAIYLVIWLLDKVTVEYWETFPTEPRTQRIGVVLRGKPLSDETIAREFEIAGKKPIDKKTVRNWRNAARSIDMIRTFRAPHGYKYAVVNTLRWPSAKPEPHLPDWAK